MSFCTVSQKWAAWSGGWWPCTQQGVETQWALWSFSTQAILWFYELKGQKGCQMTAKQMAAQIKQLKHTTHSTFIFPWYVLGGSPFIFCSIWTGPKDLQIFIWQIRQQLQKTPLKMKELSTVDGYHWRFTFLSLIPWGSGPFPKAGECITVLPGFTLTIVTVF